MQSYDDKRCEFMTQIWSGDILSRDIMSQDIYCPGTICPWWIGWPDGMVGFCQARHIVPVLRGHFVPVFFKGYFGNICQLWVNFWQLLASFGNFWRLLATFGYFWQLLAAFGNFWLLLATLDDLASFWQRFGHFLPTFWQIFRTLGPKSSKMFKKIGIFQKTYFLS